MTYIKRNTHPRLGALEGTRIGDFTLCQMCGQAIQLIRSRTPETRVDHDFWVHYKPLVTPEPESHKAIPKRLWSDQ